MHRILRPIAAAAVAVAALALSACAPAATDAGDAAAAPGDASTFPVTFEHMYGSTTIEEAPTRVATWGWGVTDAVLALDIVPVAMASMDYGGGEDRIAPWVSDKIEELGGETPVILDNATYELSVEALLATDPDVFIASYSGLTQEEYDAVTAAGVPVVAPEEAIWSTPWRDVITDTGKALGLEADATAVLADLDQQVADQAAEHPEFEGTTIAYASEDVDTFYLLLENDPRVELLTDLGFTSAPSVAELATGESTFSTTVSSENLDRIDADVVFTQTETEEQLQTFLTSDRTKLIPAVSKGAVAALVGEENGAAISPTALSIPFFLPTLVEQLAAATEVANS